MDKFAGKRERSDDMQFSRGGRADGRSGQMSAYADNCLNIKRPYPAAESSAGFSWVRMSSKNRDQEISIFMHYLIFGPQATDIE
jgi:hypothetical protein